MRFIAKKGVSIPSICSGFAAPIPVKTKQMIWKWEWNLAHFCRKPGIWQKLWQMGNGQSDGGPHGGGRPQSPSNDPHPNLGMTLMCFNSQLCRTWIKAPQQAELGVQSQHCSGCCALCPNISLPSGLELQMVWHLRTPFYVFMSPFALSRLHYICLAMQDLYVHFSFWVADFFVLHY